MCTRRASDPPRPHLGQPTQPQTENVTKRLTQIEYHWIFHNGFIKTSRLIMNVRHTNFYSFLLYLVMETCWTMFCFGKCLLWVWGMCEPLQFATSIAYFRYFPKKIIECWTRDDCTLELSCLWLNNYSKKILVNRTSLKFPPLQKATFISDMWVAKLRRFIFFAKPNEHIFQNIILQYTVVTVRSVDSQMEHTKKIFECK